MSQPIWLTFEAVIALHAATIAEHGGAPGIRDEGLLRSALARPENLFAYEGAEAISRLAASYAFGIARNHPFVDGNKRSAFLAAAVFIETNGLHFVASEADAADVFLALAAGEFSEGELAAWLEANSTKR